MEMFDLINKITHIPSVSGNEKTALPVIKEILSPYTDNVFCDNFGNIKAVFGKGGILLEAHIDKIGMIVTFAGENGFIKAAPIGSIDARILPAGNVKILAEKELYGVAASVPPHLASAEDSKTAKEVTDVNIDTGLSTEEAKKLICVGDRIMYDEKTVMLSEDELCSMYLDNSIGAAVIIRTVEILKEHGSLDNLTLCFTAQEEAGLRGAGAAVYGAENEKVICVDTSFASSPGVRPEKSGRMGAGPMIGFSPVLDSEMSCELKKLAEEKEIPYSVEVMGASTGTNADVISKSFSGFRTALVSVPIRNMHTPSEICDLNDIEDSAYLIAEYIMKGEKE